MPVVFCLVRKKIHFIKRSHWLCSLARRVLSMYVIMFSHTCSRWNWMVFQEIYASRHFQVDASSIILLHALSQMIRMKTCQSLFTRPSIGQEISMLWADSQFIYLFLAGHGKTTMVKMHFSLTNLRISTLGFSTYTKCGQMVKYIIGTHLYWNGSNIIFSRCRCTMWIFGKKGATHLEDAIVSNINREVMNMFQSVSIL